MSSGATTPAAVLAAAVARAGADTAFGVPGGGPNLDVVGALAERGIRFVLVHGETAACIMASVYGYLTGRPAAAVVTRGPGAASAVNGAAQATLDRLPLVLVTDRVPVASARRVAHQRIDQRALLAPVTKASTVLGADTTEAELVELLGLAGRPPAGAIHLDYDASARRSPRPAPGRGSGDGVCSGRVAESESIAAWSPGTGERPRSTEAGMIAERLAAASRPVVILGLGAVDHGSGLRPVLEALGAPILTTYQAIGTVPTEHPLAAGLFTNGASEQPLLARADLVVTIGLDPVEPIPAPWSYEAPVVSLTNTPTLDPYLPTELELVASDLALAATAVVTGRASGWEPDAGSAHRHAVRTALCSAPPIQPQPAEARPALTPVELVRTMVAHAPPTATITVDAGAHFLAIMPLWPVEEPKQLLISNGLATMGYAVPAAVAAALARPDRPVLCLVGDGGLGMTLAELETIGRLGLPITVVVFNDSALSLIEIKQGPGHGGAAAVSYRPTDFAAMAPSFGLSGTRASSVDELAASIDGPWSGPRLVDASVDPASYAHLLRVTRG